MAIGGMLALLLAVPAAAAAKVLILLASLGPTAALASCISLTYQLIFLYLLPLAGLQLWRLRAACARSKVIGFLHPFCNDGGGGERVLWVAVMELTRQQTLRVEDGFAGLHSKSWEKQEAGPAAPGGICPTAASFEVVVYTGDEASDEEIRAHARARFGLEVPEAVRFVRLRYRRVVEPACYPVATLLGQCVGSLWLLLEALCREPPRVLVDTTGFGFAYVLAKLCGVGGVACYVHYPIVSSDMLARVAERKAEHNNAALISRSSLLTALKLGYYRLLLAAYSFSGSHADVVMANGTWTAAHLKRLWAREVSVVYPPCDTRALEQLPLGPRPTSVLTIVSIAQFRPEKDHALQLRAFALLLRKAREKTREGRSNNAQGLVRDAAASTVPRVRLVLAGAVRHAADKRRLEKLQDLAAELGLTSDEVHFAPNLPRSALMELYGSAAVGLHTMWNEHFGIGVVEMMAAGVPSIAHASGGPALDIIDAGRTGMLATTADEYSEALAALLYAPDAAVTRQRIAREARESVRERFSQEQFAAAFVANMRRVLLRCRFGGLTSPGTD